MVSVWLTEAVSWRMRQWRRTQQCRGTRDATYDRQHALDFEARSSAAEHSDATHDATKYHHEEGAVLHSRLQVETSLAGVLCQLGNVVEYLDQRFCSDESHHTECQHQQPSRLVHPSSQMKYINYHMQWRHSQPQQTTAVQCDSAIQYCMTVGQSLYNGAIARLKLMSQHAYRHAFTTNGGDNVFRQCNIT